MENPTLGRIEAEYLNGVRSGNVRKKRLRNRNRRIRRDRASGMSYIDLGAKYGLTRNELYIIVHDLRSSSSGVERRPGGRRSRDDGGDGHG